MTSSTTVVRVSKNKMVNPGPGAYAMKSTFGTEGIKSSFGGRPKDKETQSSAGYENIGSTIGQGPKWSFHGRPKERASSSLSPGPDYVPPSFGKNAQKSAFHGYVKETKTSDITPGPGEYQIKSTLNTKSKAFSIKGRVFPPDEVGKSDSPGPKFNPNYKFVLPSTKAYQYHQKIETKEKIDPSPGPGQYTIQRKLAGSAMSFHGYHREPKKDIFPGPGLYDVKSELGSDAPRFSIRRRIDRETKVTGAPYECIKSTIGNDGPKYSFGNRRDIQGKDPGPPGPNYVPPPFGKGSRQSSLYSRRDETKRTTPMQTPGPGEYAIKSEIGGGKKFTLKHRQFPPDENGKAVSPGPAAYTPKFNDAPPPRTIHPRLQDPADKEVKPGYSAPQYTFGSDAPKFTIGRKENMDLAPGIP